MGIYVISRCLHSLCLPAVTIISYQDYVNRQ